MDAPGLIALMCLLLVHHSFNKASDGGETLSAGSDPLDDYSLPELRLVLLGRRGSGKSVAGNIILGREEFELHRDDVTADSQRCVKARALVQNTRVSISIRTHH